MGLRGPTLTLVGLVIIFAVSAVGFGYAAFGASPGPGMLYHAAFLVFTAAFLVAFVRLIWTKAEHHVESDRTQVDQHDSLNDE
jgi:hypothetical protein